MLNKFKQEKTQARTIRIHQLNLEGLTNEEIAKREQVSKVTVKRHLSRAVEMNLNGVH